MLIVHQGIFLLSRRGKFTIILEREISISSGNRILFFLLSEKGIPKKQKAPRGHTTLGRLAAWQPIPHRRPPPPSPPTPPRTVCDERGHVVCIGHNHVLALLASCGVQDGIIRSKFPPTIGGGKTNVFTLPFCAFLELPPDKVGLQANSRQPGLISSWPSLSTNPVSLKTMALFLVKTGPN